MTLFKLAYKNVKSQFSDYVIYFFSISFSIMIYFSFVSMANDEALLAAASKSAKLDVALQFSGVMILVFAVLFMIYANNFFIKKRKKEIGLYNLLGMKKLQISKLFFMENMVVGVVALASGIVLGVILSKLFMLILLRMMQSDVTASFSFSMNAVFQTIIIFVLIFLFTSIQNASLVYRYRLIDLFKANSDGNKLPKIGFFSYFFGILGLGMMLFGYYLANDFMHGVELFHNDFFMAAIVIFLSTIIGTYLFFNAFLVVFIKMKMKNKKTYYRGMNLITTSNLLFRIKKNASTLATIAILSATTLSAVGGASIVYSYVSDQVDRTTTYDIVYDESNPAAASEIAALIAQNPDHKITAETEISYKTVEATTKNTVKQGNGEEVDDYYSVISESDYNQSIEKNKGGKKVQLENNQQTLLISMMYSDEFFDSPKGNSITLKDSNETFDIQDIATEAPVSSVTTYNMNLLVVSDVAYQKIKGIEPEYHYRAVNVTNAKDMKALANAIRKVVTEKVSENQRIPLQDNRTQTTEASAFNDATRAAYITKYEVSQEVFAVFGLIMYVAAFLGLVFMVATGSIIMLKQLSEAQEEIGRYRILKKIGVNRKEIKKTVYKQTGFVFALPIIVGITHAIFALRLASSIFMNPSILLTFLACGMFIFIYAVFFLFTARAYNKIVNGSMVQS
ncbi:ABC transporter permease [Isobaculum melis]|uniref:Putative ABC transport system permease protein n=1 Tax=Isobaculum melis TaxID=142588 RepID=A0A1H9RI15_9LACT|nr:ABC transporter permease [Isobaculum melis]SER72287.1 putative ABC transport system permease protein [Isobaculum melis]